MIIPKIGSRWRREENWNGLFTYRVIAVANLGRSDNEKYPVTVVYQGDNGLIWANTAKQWPGGLVEL